MSNKGSWFDRSERASVLTISHYLKSQSVKCYQWKKKGALSEGKTGDSTASFSNSLGDKQQNTWKVKMESSATSELFGDSFLEHIS